MKKLILLLISVLLLASCVSKSPYITDHPEFTEDGAPYWTVLTPINKDRFYGVGMGQLSNPVNSKMRAEAGARDEIARQVSVLINTAVKNYTNEAGLLNNTQELTAFETISLQVANTTLRNVIIENTYQDPKTKAIWVIASFEKKYLPQAYKAEAENLKRNLEKRKIAAIEALALAKERNAQAIEQINLTNSENKEQQLQALAKALEVVVSEKNKEIEALKQQEENVKVDEMLDNLNKLLK
ncbi:MAG: hypothetical protein EOL97_00905 [Spirochaetia bacterium]|nr:hypothetical protein [Spirochaetia bacterium]